MNYLFVLAVIIFLATYAIIITEKYHRTIIAMFGASLMVLLGIVNQERAIEGIDFNTLGLLIGMMVIVSIAKDSGMFQYVAIKAAKIGQGDPKKIFILLAGLVAIFSALLDNVTTVLLMVPVTLVVTNNLRVKPKPYLIMTILMSNIGGTSTLIGDPPNIMIGSAVGLSFNDFLMNLFPVAAIIALATVFLLIFIYKKEFVADQEAKEAIMKFNPNEALTNKSLLVKSLVVLGIVLLGFFTHSMTHIEGATIALSGAALLLLLTVHEPDENLKEVEWTTIFFFIGLFILVTGLEEVGALHLMAGKIIELTQGNLTATTMVILWFSAIFSAVVDNIPFVATMIPLIKDIGAITGMSLAPLWWALAIGADIGGNATIVGASANVVVSGIAGREGYRIGFVEYMKIAVPLTFVAMLIATVYIYFRYLM
ncbi:MAG: hypothetical protein A2469_04370 [Candidatus Magasanikbacteria bacterium RIFOXYC2_FULL_40_16]|uniref:Citrate transporter-like domain-containing protein n=2 Tax=Candidatus Magasanikiibacteriota TaxID=1752731 RepID=A0A1F6NIW6_9BACT|nr:MAG: hypothetical protein A2373_02010 [Candidatus Magasanikbacteria bacterium RIFOXYB1_FULL_40_15]OGH85034.1 MAG: hypothetical protein A2301_02765 [Candidatus Magasanikbacteria bacterium RIFOXYB2_FULL_40_13]OGH90295.1 MAG: hypothetical protein A2469_04370 [Candidatus Magasanikbacteria bacterium RIFOXYC2_FULL_40_16]